MLVRDLSNAQKAVAAAGIPADAVDFVVGDVTRPDTLSAALKKNDIDYVVSSIGAWDAKKVDFQGNVNLIDASKAAGAKGFLLISSCSVTRTFSALNLLGLAKPKLAGALNAKVCRGLRALCSSPCHL